MGWKTSTKIIEKFGKKTNLQDEERTNIQRFVSQNFKTQQRLSILNGNF
jgi:hypothetical protein